MTSIDNPAAAPTTDPTAHRAAGGHGTPNGTPNGTARGTGVPSKPGWFKRRAEERAAARQRAEDDRAAEQRAADDERAATSAAAGRAAARARAASRAVTSTARSPEEIAPVPDWLQKTGVWLTRTIGTIPLLAPLCLSAYFTAHVFIDDPMTLPLWASLMATFALEGGAWRLARIYERTLLEGDSTMALRLGLVIWLSVISGLIYWHAWYQAGQTAEMGWGWVPAVVCAALSWMGIYINGRAARFQHRVMLRQAGKVDMAAPKFMMLSWGMMPWDTFFALRHAIKFRISSPVEAFEDRRHYLAAGKPAVWPPADSDVPSAVAEIVPSPPAARAAGRAAPKTAHPVPPGPAVPRRALPSVPSDPAAGGTANGTPNGTAQFAIGAAHPGANGGTPAANEGANGAPRHAAQHDGTVRVDAEMMSYADHVMILDEAFPAWRQSVEALPSIAKAIEAIDKARRQRDPEDKGFNSSSTTRKVLAAMRRMHASGEVELAMDQLQPLGPIN